jgi:hypothetical protein
MVKQYPFLSVVYNWYWWWGEEVCSNHNGVLNDLLFHRHHTLRFCALGFSTKNLIIVIKTSNDFNTILIYFIYL